MDRAGIPQLRRPGPCIPADVFGVFLSERRLGPTRRPGTADLCPTIGRARLGYDRARVLFHQHTGWELHQLRHSAATHLGDKGVPLQLILAKTWHRNPRTVLRYVKPGAERSPRSPSCSNLPSGAV
jgi:hypothetical protein